MSKQTQGHTPKTSLLGKRKPAKDEIVPPMKKYLKFSPSYVKAPTKAEFMLHIGPASVLSTYFTASELPRFSLLCRDYYYRVQPALNYSVILGEEPKFEFADFFGLFKNSTLEKLIKRSLKVTIDDIKGTYYGQHNFKASRIPSGYGILVSDAKVRMNALFTQQKVIIGYTEDGEWQLSRPQIIISNTVNEVQVTVPKLAIPSGNQIGTTKSFYNQHGLTRSEVHFDNGTVLELNAQNQASDSFGKNCKYITFGSRRFGECNEANELNGKGIVIYFDGTIYIKYYEDGDMAPGNFIHIYSGGEIRVGEIYLKDGEKCFRGTEYLKDGTARKFNF